MASRSSKVMVAAVAGILALGGLCVVCIVAVVYLPLSAWAKGGAWSTAQAFLRNHPTVVGELGPVQSFGSLPSGSIRTHNGSGEAHLTITIRGTLGEGSAKVDMVKGSGGKWQVVSAVLTAHDQELPLKVETAPPIPGPSPEATPDAGAEPEAGDGGVAA